MERTNQKEYLQKEIILFPCPYSDFSSTKVRPAIIVSNNKYNKNQLDIVVMPITTKRKENYSVPLTQKDLLQGEIAHESEIRADKIITISKSIIITQIGITNEEILEQITNKLLSLLTEQN